ncbi:hypothetical protein TWF481_010598 [Arthrobotrys musiformis]|uniref:Uncharacterized protein n=1 Tax=Arthrobotrys musiformis TaxID=47236 RepID=A0AAV9W338_9PEZI
MLDRPEVEKVIVGPWRYHDSKTVWDSYVCTLTNDQYSLLNNFLVVFLTLVAERFWVIVVYIIHQCGSHGKPRDGLRRAFEVYVRNSSALGIVTSGLKLLASWAGRSHAQARTWAKNIGIVFIALGTLVAFQVAGIYVSKIELGGVARLKSSETCGVYLSDNDQRGSLEDVRALWKSMTDKWSIPYSSYFLKDFSPFLNVTTIPCPFDPKICFKSDKNKSESIQIDTGPISIRTYGINTAEDISIRSVHSCAVLSTKEKTYKVRMRDLMLNRLLNPMEEYYMSSPKDYYYTYGASKTYVFGARWPYIFAEDLPKETGTDGNLDGKQEKPPKPSSRPPGHVDGVNVNGTFIYDQYRYGKTNEDSIHTIR